MTASVNIQSEKASILLIYTGGTIGMIENPETGVLESAILYNCCSRLLATRGAANWNSILVIFPFVIYGS